MELYRRLPAPGEVATITAEMHDTMFHEEGVPPFEVPPKFFEDVLRFFSDAAPDAFPIFCGAKQAHSRYEGKTVSS